MSSPLVPPPIRTPAWPHPTASSPSSWHLPPAPSTPEKHTPSPLHQLQGLGSLPLAPYASTSAPVGPSAMVTSAQHQQQHQLQQQQHQDGYPALPNFSSPDHTPLPAHSHALLEAKRQELFTIGPSVASRSPQIPPHFSARGTRSRSRYALDDHAPPSAGSGSGPLRLAGNRGRIHHHHRSTETASFSSPERLGSAGEPGTTSPPLDQDSPTRQVWRTKFRERCRLQMARDRARVLANTRGSSFLGLSDPDHEGGESEAVLTPGSREGAARLRRDQMPGSDDLASSSDLDGDADMDDHRVGAAGPCPPKWWEEDEELIRRVMVAEYRRIKRAHEISGEQVGWLDPDEVEWLEEETRREEDELRSATSYAGVQRGARPDPVSDPNKTPSRNVGPRWAPGLALQRPAGTTVDPDSTLTFPGPYQTGVEMQPPEDLVDEDETLYSQFLHLQHQTHNPDLSTSSTADAETPSLGMDEDMDGSEGQSTEALLQSWGCDQDFEMALAAMPLPQA